MTSVAALVLLTLCGQETISSSEYRERLSLIRSSLDAGDLASARRKAADLQPLRVRQKGQEFAAVISQVRLLSTKRLLRKMYVIDERIFQPIQKRIKHMI